MKNNEQSPFDYENKEWREFISSVQGFDTALSMLPVVLKFFLKNKLYFDFVDGRYTLAFMKYNHHLEIVLPKENLNIRNDMLNAVFDTDSYVCEYFDITRDKLIEWDILMKQINNGGVRCQKCSNIIYDLNKKVFCPATFDEVNLFCDRHL